MLVCCQTPGTFKQRSVQCFCRETQTFSKPTFMIRSLRTAVGQTGFGFSTVADLNGDGLLVCRRELQRPQFHRLERLAFQTASVPESYDIVVSDGQLLQSPCGEGVASVVPDGRFWHIAGGILAPDAVKPEMIAWLSALAQDHRKTIAVYNVPEIDAKVFRAAGFIVNKFGEEPVIDLGKITWQGREFEWVRRQTNFCRRAGLQVSEISDSTQQQQLADLLLEIVSEDLQHRTFDRPLRLLEGEFVPHALQRRRLFVARNTAGHIEAFLACSPLHGGRGWAFETYRKRRTATRGVTAFLFREAIDLLQKEGAERVSLCLVPGRGVAEQRSTDAEFAQDWRVQKILSLWFHRLDFIFNAKGQDHFKSRFRPRYLNRYLCIAPKNSARSIWSFLKVSGALTPNVRNMLGQLQRSRAAKRQLKKATR